MTEQVNFTLSLLTACVMQQNQLLTQHNAMQRELMDRVESVCDLLWRMDPRRSITRSQVDQTGPGKRAAQKRKQARAQAHARKRSGKKA